MPKRNVAILVFDDVEVLDFAGPFEVFNVARELISPEPFYVYTVALVERVVQGRGNFAVQPHYTLDTCPRPDVLIIPGGLGIRHVLKHERLLAWVQQHATTVEKLCSVCTGSLLLANAGLLAGLPATTHHGAFDELSALSPTTTVVRDQRFVDTGRIITSGGISAGIDMALYVVQQLCGSEAQATVITEMEYQWHIPAK
ncbi:MAG: DJ-1/PfpI family protein [Armatimonadetes bacterium]|nr:DJ-1/PfpI family protein [Anaerolineae bacterium]